jgi:hypothetical protein
MAAKVPAAERLKKAMAITPCLAGQAFEPEVIRQMSLALRKRLRRTEIKIDRRPEYATCGVPRLRSVRCPRRGHVPTSDRCRWW